MAIKNIKNLTFRVTNILTLTNYLLFLILFTVGFTPYLSRLASTNFYVLLVISWLSVAFVNKPKFFVMPSKLTFFTFILIIYLIISRIIGVGDSSYGNLFYYIIFWFTIIMIEYFIHLDEPSLNRKSVNFIFFISAFNIITNIIELSKNSELSKLITGGVLSGSNSNVGTYSFAFMISLIGFVFYFQNKRQANIIMKLIYIFLTVISFYMVYLSSSMISIITIIVIAFVFYFLYLTEKFPGIKNKVFILIIVTIIFLFLLYNSELVHNMLLNFASGIKNKNIQIRSIYIINSIFDSSAFISTVGRFNLYKKSLVTFFKNPILGVGMQHIKGYEFVSLHSQILDDLAYFGLFGFILQLKVLMLFSDKFLKKQTYNFNRLIVPFYSAVIYFSLFNLTITSTISSGFVIFCLIPMVIKKNRIDTESLTVIRSISK